MRRRTPMPDKPVFVVDDDAAVRQGLRFMLRAAGYTVEVIPSVLSFLEDYNPRRGRLPLARCPNAADERARFAAAAQCPRLAYPGYLHHRPWHRFAGDCSDEGWGLRLHREAVARGCPARKHRASIALE